MQIIIPMSGIGKRFIIEAWIIKIHTRKKHPYHGILYIIRSYVSFCGGEDYICLYKKFSYDINF